MFSYVFNIPPGSTMSMGLGSYSPFCVMCMLCDSTRIRLLVLRRKGVQGFKSTMYLCVTVSHVTTRNAYTTSYVTELILSFITILCCLFVFC